MYQESVKVPMNPSTIGRLQRLRDRDKTFTPTQSGSPFARNLAHWLGKETVPGKKVVLLPLSPLRTVRNTFALYWLKPLNASLRKPVSLLLNFGYGSVYDNSDVPTLNYLTCLGLLYIVVKYDERATHLLR